MTFGPRFARVGCTSIHRTDSDGTNSYSLPTTRQKPVFPASRRPFFSSGTEGAGKNLYGSFVDGIAGETVHLKGV